MTSTPPDQPSFAELLHFIQRSSKRLRQITSRMRRSRRRDEEFRSSLFVLEDAVSRRAAEVIAEIEEPSEESDTGKPLGVCVDGFKQSRTAEVDERDLAHCGGFDTRSRRCLQGTQGCPLKRRLTRQWSVVPQDWARGGPGGFAVVGFVSHGGGACLRTVVVASAPRLRCLLGLRFGGVTLLADVA